MNNRRRKMEGRMKTLRVIGFLLIIFLLPAYSYSSDLGSMRISLLDGDVQLKMHESDDWVPAAINTPLREGDRLWIPDDARIEVNLSDGTFLRLDENSSLEILTVDKDSSQFYLNRGHAYINFKGRSDSLIQIDTPFSSTRTYDRAKFMIDVSENGQTDVAVLKGIVYAESRSGKTKINSGKTLSIREDNYADLYPLGPADSWERWNRDRDQLYEERSYSSKYLPDELDSYSYDLDEHGKWVYVVDHGYVWTPSVYVSADWSPYRVGRWAWIGSDYVWISYEPWGWAPYHYGRWAFVSSIGWCWIPPLRGSIYWGPGYVGWVQTPTYVAWIPLAPGEIYYGYGYYGPHSVNIVNINIHKTVIKHEYKNVHHKNSVVVLHNDTFTKGKHIAFTPRENPFLKEKISVGRPNITPVKTSWMPVIKDIPQAKQPPKPVRDVYVPALKKERPLVKEKSATVILHGTSPKNMPTREITEPKERRFKSSVGLTGTTPQKKTGSEPVFKQELPKKPDTEKQADRVKEQKEWKMKTPTEKEPSSQMPELFEKQRKTEKDPVFKRDEQRKTVIEQPSESHKEPSERKIRKPKEFEHSPSSQTEPVEKHKSAPVIRYMDQESKKPDFEKKSERNIQLQDSPSTPKKYKQERSIENRMEPGMMKQDTTTRQPFKSKSYEAPVTQKPVVPLERPTTSVERSKPEKPKPEIKEPISQGAGGRFDWSRPGSSR